MDAMAFLRRFPPFDTLDAERLQLVADASREERYPAGAAIVLEAGKPARSLYVIVGGKVEVVAEGRVLDVLGEGDIFGQMSLLTGEDPVATIRARDGTHCLLIERSVAEEVLGTRPGAAFLAASVRRRFDRLASVLDDEAGHPPELTVGALVRRSPVVCDPSEPVAEVARAMARGRTSAAVIPLPEGPAIVTDADLRTKVLAAGRDPSTPVREIVTSPASTITEDALAAEALFQMVQGGFHHLPVVSTAGDVIGVVTETDLIGLGADSPFSIRSAIEHSEDAAAAVEAARRLPTATAALVDGGVGAVHVGHVIGATIDVLTRRLLDLAFDVHGQPPVAWAWLAFGSLGRHEQALHTDQDHGLAFEGTGREEEGLDRYFGRIATFVTQGLEDAGLPRCRGNVMAENPRMRRSLAGWVDAFAQWIQGGDILVLGAVSIVCDFRRVAGPLDVEPSLDRVVRSAGRVPGFLHRLAKQALEHKPPTGLIRDFLVERSGEHAGRLDLKHGGILPITDVARFHAVTAGVSAHRTLDRLRLALEADLIDESTRQSLDDAFRLLWRLRLENQVACVRAGRQPDDFIDPAALPALQRQGLREAFRIVGRAQRRLSAEAMWPST